MFKVKMADHYRNLKFHVKKFIVFILPSRWQDSAESLRIDRPQKLSMVKVNKLKNIFNFSVENDSENEDFLFVLWT